MHRHLFTASLSNLREMAELLMGSQGTARVSRFIFSVVVSEAVSQRVISVGFPRKGSASGLIQLLP